MNLLNRVMVYMCLFCGSLAWAGEVILVNGDRLSGTVDAIVGGTLQLRSPLLGQVEIDMIHVDSISSDEIVTVVLSDGRTVARRLRGIESRRVQLQDDQGRIEQAVELDQIEAVNPPPKEEPQWTGSITGGLTSIHGNTQSQSVQAGVSLSKRDKAARTSLGGDYGRAERDDEVTEDWWRLRGKYDRFLSEKFYVYGEGRYAVDKVADLDRRIIGGAGGGYQWIESERMNFSTEAGAAHVTEKYKDRGSDDRMTAQASYYFDTVLNQTLTFKHDLSYFPSTEKFSDYYLTTSFELRARLTETMFTNFRTIFDYDATPAPGKSSTDIKHILGVGWDF